MASPGLPTEVPTPARSSAAPPSSRFGRLRERRVVAGIVVTAALVALLVVGIASIPGHPRASGGLPSTPSGVPPNAGGGINVASAGGCPNQYFYNQPTTLSLQAVVDCASNAGFSGGVLITFVSMAYQESGFDPAAIENTAAHALGILQLGTSGQPVPQGSPTPWYGYNPSTCSTYNSIGNWGGVYFNPVCSFQWAYTYYSGGGGYQFWGSYLSGAYCKWAPNGFTGTGSVPCSGTGQNQANLPWSTVCPNNSCSGGGGGSQMTVTYSAEEYTYVGSQPGYSNDWQPVGAVYCGGTVHSYQKSGDMVEFQASVSGGTGSYSESWNFGSSGWFYNGASWVYYSGASNIAGSGVAEFGFDDANAGNSVNVQLTVTDSGGSSANTGCSFTVVD